MVRRSIAVWVLASAFIGASDAAATEVDSYPASGRDGGYVYVVGGRAANDLVIDRDPVTREFLITDNHPIVVDENCREISRTQAACDSRGHLIVEGGGGKDRMALAPSLGRTDNSLAGGAKQDVIIGSSHGDWLYGDNGDDRLFGRGGDDHLNGESGSLAFPKNPGDDLLLGGAGHDDLGDRFETGADSFFGGPGRDRINSQDMTEDVSVSGGDGGDGCRVDAIDPSPRLCERIKTVAS